jgi:hypothetical protein
VTTIHTTGRWAHLVATANSRVKEPLPKLFARIAPLNLKVQKCLFGSRSGRFLTRSRQAAKIGPTKLPMPRRGNA